MKTEEKNMVIFLLALIGIFLFLKIMPNSTQTNMITNKFSCERYGTEVTCSWSDCTDGLIIISGGEENQIKELETRQGTYTFVGVGKEMRYATLVCDEGVIVRKIFSKIFI
ncbi:MAG: hypothetical protein J7J92_03500 [Candidatus Aenigmarchaeota archaeon]|nr:hypothetical protein [Candidatus Aenigmarchaeota archaeon]